MLILAHTFNYRPRFASDDIPGPSGGPKKNEPEDPMLVEFRAKNLTFLEKIFKRPRKEEENLNEIVEALKKLDLTQDEILVVQKNKITKVQGNNAPEDPAPDIV